MGRVPSRLEDPMERRKLPSRVGGEAPTVHVFRMLLWCNETHSMTQKSKK